MYRYFLIALCLIPTIARAQEDWARILVPLVVTNQPGAFGTTWNTETWGFYDGIQPAIVLPTPFCYAILCTSPATLPTRTVPWVLRLEHYEHPAVLMHVSRAHVGAFRMHTQVTSGRSTAGIPSVPEDEFRRVVRLFNVSIAEGNRATLRIYGLPEVPNPAVTIRYLQMPVMTGSGLSRDVVLLAEETVMLTTPSSAGTIVPSYAQRTISTIASLNGERIWVEISAPDSLARLWAMISVTDNTTQAITIIHP